MNMEGNFRTAIEALHSFNLIVVSTANPQGFEKDDYLTNFTCTNNESNNS